MLAVAARLNPIAAEAPARKVLLKTVFLLLIQGSCTITGKREDSTSTRYLQARFFHCTKMDQASQIELIIRF
jgi:hypothetical protein